MKCQVCFHDMAPAPAKRDGEDTFVGFMPCVCSREAWQSGGQDGETFREYRDRILADAVAEFAGIKFKRLMRGTWRGEVAGLEIDCWQHGQGWRFTLTEGLTHPPFMRGRGHGEGFATLPECVDAAMKAIPDICPRCGLIYCGCDTPESLGIPPNKA